MFHSFLPLTYVVRTAADPASLIVRIRAEAAAMDRDVPIAELSTLASYVSNALSQTRFLLALIGAFAALALGLASLGLCGVSHSVVDPVAAVVFLVLALFLGTLPIRRWRTARRDVVQK